MQLEETTRHIRACLERMSGLYQQTVFDEWAIIQLQQGKLRVLAYHGPRRDTFNSRFLEDVDKLRFELFHQSHSPGQFEFARGGTGTRFDAFMALGGQSYLICNNTQHSMQDLTRNPRWIEAQVPFAELGENLHSHPLALD